MSGTPVFDGSRAPVQTLIDHLEAGETIDDFLDGFPTVKREQVIAFLEGVKQQLIFPKQAAREFCLTNASIGGSHVKSATMVFIQLQKWRGKRLLTSR